jgi:hypothetical protein
MSRSRVLPFVGLAFLLAMPACGSGGDRSTATDAGDRRSPTTAPAAVGRSIDSRALSGTPYRAGRAAEGSAVPVVFNGSKATNGRIVFVDGASRKVATLPDPPLGGRWLSDSDVVATKDWVLVAASLCAAVPKEGDASLECQNPDFSPAELSFALLAFDRTHDRWKTAPIPLPADGFLYLESASGASFTLRTGAQSDPVRTYRQVRLSASAIDVGAAQPAVPEPVRCGLGSDRRLSFDQATEPTSAQVTAADGEPALEVSLPAAVGRLGPGLSPDFACVSAGHFLLLPGRAPALGRAACPQCPLPPSDTATSLPLQPTSSGIDDSLLYDLARPDLEPLRLSGGTAELYARGDRWAVSDPTNGLTVGRGGTILAHPRVAEPSNISIYDGGLLLFRYRAGGAISGVDVVPFEG